MTTKRRAQISCIALISIGFVCMLGQVLSCAYKFGGMEDLAKALALIVYIAAVIYCIWKLEPDGGRYRPPLTREEFEGRQRKS